MNAASCIQRFTQRLLARPRQSSTYRGKSYPTKSAPPADKFRRARADLTKKTSKASLSMHEATLFRREETIAARLLGPLALFHVVGALAFCKTIVTDTHASEAAVRGKGGEEMGVDNGSAGRMALKRGLACAVAVVTAVGVVYTAYRFNTGRLVEICVVGRRTLKLYTRSMIGFPSLSLAREVEVGMLGVDHGRLRRAGKLAWEVREAKGKKKVGEACYVMMTVLEEGSVPVASYTIDAREGVVLDVDGIVGVTKDTGMQ